MQTNRAQQVGAVARINQRPLDATRAVPKRRFSSTCRSYNTDRDANKAVLEAFFIGRAFAETVNDRLGAALGDLLSEIAKADAERRQAWKEFQEEVQERARLEFKKATQASRSQQQQQISTRATLPTATTNRPAGPAGSSPTQLPALPRTTTGKPIGPAARSQPQAQAPMNGRNTSPKLQETVDDIRAETASSRAILQQIKADQDRRR